MNEGCTLMTDKIKEQISAFVDDELDFKETDLLLRRFEQDAELRATVGRYALVGDAIRDALAPAPMSDFPSGVRAAIDDAAEDSKPAVLPRASMSKVLKGVGGFAIAATVATVAILTLQTPDEQFPEPPKTASNGPFPGPENIVPEPMDSAQIRLTEYLLQHSEYSASMGPKGMLTRIVSHADFEVAADSEAEVDDNEDIEENGQQ